MNCFNCDKFFDDKKNIPLNLLCGHCFCKKCIENFYNINNYISCFKCDFKDKITNPSTLSKNFIALNLGCQQKEIMKKYKFCIKHKSEPLRFFCENCKIPFCPSCIVNHNGHKFINKNFSTEKLVHKIDKLVSKLDQKILLFKKNLDYKKNKINKTENLNKKYRKKFDNYYNKYLNLINLKYNNILKKLVKHDISENKIIIEKEELINNYLLKINEFQNNINKLKNEIKEDNNFEKSEIIEKIENIKIDINKIYEEYENKLKINFENIFVNDLNFENNYSFTDIFQIKNKNYEPCIVMIGEQRKILIYKIISNKWEFKTLILNTDYFFNSNSSITQYNENKIIITGGNFKKQCVMLNLNNLKIKFYPDMIYHRINHSSIFFNNKLFVLGGLDEMTSHIINNCEYLDFETKKWVSIASMNNSRIDFGVILLNENTIIIAGGNNNSTWVKTVEKYNIKENKWTTLNIELQNNNHKCKIYKFSENEIILISNSIWKTTKEIIKINVETNKIENINLDLINQSNINIFYNDKILFFGGNNFFSNSYNLEDKKLNELIKYDEFLKSNLDNWLFCLMDNYIYDKEKFSNDLIKNSNSLMLNYDNYEDDGLNDFYNYDEYRNYNNFSVSSNDENNVNNYDPVENDLYNGNSVNENYDDNYDLEEIERWVENDLDNGSSVENNIDTYNLY